MKKSLTVIGFPLLFILPWISYLISLINIKSRMSAFIYIFCAAFFGYAIGFSNTSADSYRYALAFMSFERPDSYLSIIEMYLDGELRDIYRISLFYIASFFGNSANLVYAFAGLVYGLITYSNLRIYVYERGAKTGIYTFILALLFITFCSLSNINGFRFNTGAMLAFYSIYKLVIEDKKIWVVGLFVAPLMHYSFALLIPVILIIKLVIPFTYRSSSTKSFIFYIFVITFASSFFLSTNIIDVNFITSSNILPSAASDRMSYVNSEQVTEIVDARSEGSLFLTVSSYFSYLVSAYVFFVILYMRNFIKKNSIYSKEINIMFSFTVLYYSFAYIAGSIPSGLRFMDIAHMFLIIFLCRFYKFYGTYKIKRLIFISIIPFSFKILFTNIAMPILLLNPKFWYGGFVGVLLDNLGSIG